jgi:hypothetical protein
MPFVILPTNSISGGYDITNSLRFNSGSTDNLTRTPATAGNRRTFTISTWVKRSKLGTTQQIIVAHPTLYAFARFQTDDKLYFDGDDAVLYRATTQVFRDVSAWYHIVIAVDTTLATANDRIKIYVNGVQITAFDTTVNPTQNTQTNFNNSTQHWIGCFVDNSQVFDGYMSEFYMIDGQQLTPSSFGETDFDTGIWKPKAYTGSYGTNGFYLQFKNSASLGTDSSGNGNTFTVNNLTSIDQTTDTPTNNFATFNPLIKTPATFTDGNLSLNNGGDAEYNGSMATIVPTKGKWYAEIKVTNSQYLQIGFITAQTLIDGNRSLYAQSSNIYWQDNNAVVPYYLNAVYQGIATVTGGTNSLSTYTTNDIIMLAMDLDNGYGWFGKNGTWGNSGNPASGTNAFYLASDYANGTTIYQGGSDAGVSANFGNPPYSANSYTDGAGYGNFSYAVPSGYYSLNTRNLANFG